MIGLVIGCSIIGITIILGFSIPKIIEYNSLKNSNDYHFSYSPYTYTDFYNATKDLPTFTFTQFLKFYNLNSNSWIIYNHNKELAPLPAKRGKDILNYPCSYSRVYHPIFFTNIFEYFKYKKWAKKKLKEATKKDDIEKQTAATKKFVALVQEDIDTIRSENEKVLQETEDTLCKSLTNLQQERKIRILKNGELYKDTIYCGIESGGKPVRAYVSTKYNENMQIAGSIIKDETGNIYIHNGKGWVKYND